MNSQQRDNVFISYSRLDSAWLKRLTTMLSPLERAGRLLVWDDTDIPTGAKWREEIQQALDSCKAAVLLVTDNFLASSFIMNEELPLFLKKAEKEGLHLFPILVSDCLYDRTELKNFQFAHNPGLPLSTLPKPKRNQLLADIARKLDNLLDSPSTEKQDLLHTPTNSRRTDILSLPITEYTLFGRELELNRLNAAWTDPVVNLVTVVAFGGTGKTALINHWLQNLKVHNWGSAERVFGWSFFNQGSSEDRETSSELFMAEALKFFDVAKPWPVSAWEKGRLLAQAIRLKRTLLILDGMEPLQEPPGPQGGHLRDQGLLSLLLELANENSGLCLVTSRIGIEDLKGVSPQSLLKLTLEKLTPQDGAQLLQFLGVKGSNEELRLTSDEFDGHPLALRLLGNYLVLVHEGDVIKRDQIGRLENEEQQGYHARRIMSSYEQWFDGKLELKILFLMGLFDRPAEKAALAALKNEPFMGGETSQLQEVDEVKWRSALSRLCRSGLINEENDHYDCHPLVREHFAARLQETQPDVWTEAHRLLYDYFRKKATTELPTTHEQLEPLFQAVFHACRAGQYLEAFREVYWKRINRGDEVYCTHKLGAVAADLDTIRSFFVSPWTLVPQEFPQKDQAWLFNQAGYDLRAIGKLVESREPMKAGYKLCVVEQDWKNAARCANNLSRIHLMLGEVEHSLRYAREAVEYADLGGDQFRKIAYRSNLAHALHQAGNHEQAKYLFLEVEEYLAGLPLPLGTEVRNNQYWEFLLSQLRYHEVTLRAEESLEKRDGRLLDVALDHLSLARALLIQWDMEKNQQSITESVSLNIKIEGHLNQSVKLLRQAGRQHEIPRGLLARAAFYRLNQDFSDASCDIDEAFNLAERYGMKLHLIDCHIEYARLALSQKDADTAQAHYRTALNLVNLTGYHRRDSELVEIRRLMSALPVFLKDN